MLAQSDLSFNERMVIVYRSENKKILKSQIHLVRKLLHVLSKAEEALMPEEESDTNAEARYLDFQKSDKDKEDS